MTSQRRLDCAGIEFSGHAVIRMRQRRLRAADVRRLIETGEIIDERPDGFPHAAYLVLGTISDTPFHVVVGRHPETG